jgi:hypothetical protein
MGFGVGPSEQGGFRMKHYITAGMMVMGILMAMGCQKSVSEGTEGAEITGNDPDNDPVYPRDVYGTVTAPLYPMYSLKLYLYDADDEVIDTLYFFYGEHSLVHEQDYDFCDKGINAYGHPYAWYVCAEIVDNMRDGPYRGCSAPIFSYSFTEENCDPERPSAHRDIMPGSQGTCEPNPCGF